MMLEVKFAKNAPAKRMGKVDWVPGPRDLSISGLHPAVTFTQVPPNPTATQLPQLRMVVGVRIGSGHH